MESDLNVFMYILEVCSVTTDRTKESGLRVYYFLNIPELISYFCRRKDQSSRLAPQAPNEINSKGRMIIPGCRMYSDLWSNNYRENIMMNSCVLISVPWEGLQEIRE